MQDAPDPCAIDGAGNIPSYKRKVVKCAEDEEEEDDDCGWGYWNDKLGEVPDDLDIRNVDLDSLGVTDIDSMPPVIVQCLVDKIDAEDCSVTVTYSREFGSAPRGVVGVITARTTDCVNAGGVYTSPFSAAPETDFTEDDVKQCYIETECAGACPFISFRVCATDCTNEEARQNSEDVVAGIDEGTTMIAELRDLLEVRIRRGNAILRLCFFVVCVCATLSDGPKNDRFDSSPRQARDTRKNEHGLHNNFDDGVSCVFFFCLLLLLLLLLSSVFCLLSSVFFCLLLFSSSSAGACHAAVAMLFRLRDVRRPLYPILRRCIRYAQHSTQ